MIPTLRDEGVEIRPDSARVVADLFLPGESTPGAVSRTERVIARVRSLRPEQIDTAAAQIRERFQGRHGNLEPLLAANARKLEDAQLDESTRLVLGAVFTAERAIEGAAICNPSVVMHPDQSRLAAGGSLRVIVSMRSIGEGHVSAVSFCTALIGPDRTWVFDERELPLVRALIAEGEWDPDHLRRALETDGELNEIAHAVLQKLPDRPRASDVDAAIAELPAEFFAHRESWHQAESIRMLARSRYDAAFASESALSQRVLLPVAEEELRGMEDARFVRFIDDDGTVDYRATYTAYDGRSISSRLITTSDFVHFSIQRLNGTATLAKGMALFPRRVGGRLLALTRSDGESILLARSDDGLDWGEERLVASPRRLWDIVQLGNCGPPIETERGWLVITHGVGPMRQYSLGAILLDLHDPQQVIAHLESPLLEPVDALQDGYVPNVVYLCGAIVHDGTLWIPHGVGDGRIRVVSVSLAALLDAMTRPERT